MKTTTKPAGAQDGPTVRALIEAAGLTPVRIAADLEISPTTVYRAMKGERISNLAAAAIAGALGVSVDALRVAIDRSAPDAASRSKPAKTRKRKGAAA